ncbi:MAG: hypothetical protein HYX60_05120 [Legionella longbeachae]|nr:hypothetical protein [Legionella longbeachae]
MFNKIDKKKSMTLNLTGSCLNQLTGEELVQLFSSLPKSVVSLDLSRNDENVEEVKQVLRNAGISLTGEETKAEGPK